MKKILSVTAAVLILTAAAYAGKYRMYHPYEGELKNEIISTQTVAKSDISIEERTLKPISNVANYALCYEYIIRNNTGKNITINNVTSADRITPGGAFGRSNIPQASDFVPGYGIFKSVQTDKELDRFTERLPENETISANDTMRVLMLAPRKEDHKTTFNFTVNNRPVSILVP